MNPKIVAISLVLVGAVVAVAAGAAISQGDHFFIAAVLAVVVTGLAATVMQSVMPAIAVGFITLGQRGPLLMGFGYWEVLGGLACMAMLIEYIIKRPPCPFQVKKVTILAIAVAYSIIPLHLVASKLGLGYGTVGGIRVSALVCSIIIFIWLLQNTVSWKSFIALAPWISLIPAGYFIVADVATFAFPSSIGFFHLIYPVNQDATGSGSGELFRFRGMGTAGIAILAVTASIYITSKFKGRSAFLLFALSIPFCLALIALSAFRSQFFTALIIISATLFIRSKALLAVSAVALLCLLSFLSVLHTSGTPLPDNVQRLVSWFPGNWDTAVRVDTTGSRDFRYRLWSKWAENHLPYIWLFGRGQQAEDSGSGGLKAMLMSMPYSVARSSYIGELQIDSMIESQNMHSGALAIMDYSGAIGLVLVIIASLRALQNAFWLFRHRAFLEMWEVWITLLAVCYQPRFWLTGLYSIDLPYIAVTYVLVEITRGRVTAKLKEDASLGAPLPDGMDTGYAR